MKMPNLGFDRFSGLYIWAAVIGLFCIVEPRTFATTVNLRLLAGSQAITGIVALGLLVPLAAGVFDLSIGGTLGLAVMVSAWMQEHHVNLLLTIVLTIAVGIVIGLLNSGAVLLLHVEPFIATLGMSTILGGVAYAVSNGNQISGPFSRRFNYIGLSRIFGIPLPFILLLGLGAVMLYILEYTPFGRRLFAVGGNSQAARLAGVRVERLVLVSFLCSGGIAAAAGVVLCSEQGLGSVTVGPPYLLPVFAAVFLGATQIQKGRVNVLGTLLAIYLLATGVTGLQLAGAPSWFEDLFDGLALIIAVAASGRGLRRRLGRSSISNRRAEEGAAVGESAAAEEVIGG